MCLTSFLLWPNNIPLYVRAYVCVYMPHFVYLSIDGHVNYSYLLAVVSNAAMNIYLTFCFHFLGAYISKSGIAGSCANSMLSFSKNHQTLFHSGCTILHSQQQGTRVPFVSAVITTPVKCEVISHRGFDLHVPNNS